MGIFADFFLDLQGFAEHLASVGGCLKSSLDRIHGIYSDRITPLTLFGGASRHPTCLRGESEFALIGVNSCLISPFSEILLENQLIL